MLGLLLCGEVSGGHINPAVTVALATLGKFPWRRVPHYLAAQYLGAFLASAAVFLVYWDALVWYEHDRGRYRATPDTAAIFGTYPAPHLTLWGGVGDQLLGTGLLLLCVCAITDRNNMRVSRHVSAITCPVPRVCVQAAGPLLRGSHHPRYRRLLRLQLRLRHQPRPGLCPAAVQR